MAGGFLGGKSVPPYIIDESGAIGSVPKQPSVGLLEQFGIFTPSQKKAIAQQQAIQQALLQRQMEMQQRQQALQLKSIQEQGRSVGGQLGSSFAFPAWMALAGMSSGTGAESAGGGRGLLSRIGQMIGLGGQQEALASTSQMDVGPAGKADLYLQEELRKANGDVAKALMAAGQRLVAEGDAESWMMGFKMLESGKAMDLENRGKEAGIRKDETQADQNVASTASTQQKTRLEASQAGNPGTPFTYRDPLGNEVTVRDIRDAEGRVIGIQEVGRGPSRIENVQGSPDDFRTRTQKGEDQQTYQNLRVQGRGIIQSIDNIVEELSNNPNASGQGGEILLQGKEYLDTAKTILRAIGGNDKVNLYGKDENGVALDWSKFEKAAAGRAYTKAEVADAAYAYASIIYGQKGRDVTNADVQRVLDRMGSIYSDPRLSIRLARDMQEKVRMHINNFADVAGLERDPYFAPQTRKSSVSGGGSAPQITEGRTATNPQTGEKIIFRNGKWQKL